ncbi:MAG: dihydroneopterin aldolase [Phycisphaerae bacterium]|nr:dihydroneopterin aldolase [Phycisphaerae bacterium]
MKIRIKDLRLRTVIGVEEWERDRPQEVVVNLELEFDGTAAGLHDRLEDTIDYKALKQRILVAVETSRYRLLECLAIGVLEIVRETPGIRAATVEVDKPGALRFARSVSVEVSFS